MTGYHCPLEDCSYGGEDTSLKQVRGHVTARDDHPNWREVRDQVNAGTSGPSEADSSTEGDPSEGGDDQANATNLDAEGGGEAPSEGDEEVPETPEDMPTEDEYDRQRSSINQDPSEGADEAPEGTPEAPSKGSESLLGLPSLGVSNTTLMLVVLGIVLAVLVWAVYTADTDDSAPQSVETPTDEEADEGTEGPERSEAGNYGGLVVDG